MTEDLYHFIQQHDLDQPILLGHSMGGKAVMSTALHHPTKISKLIVVDMPPVAMNLARNFKNYIEAMQAIEHAKPARQSEADQILAKYESNVGVRMFLLTNLKRLEDGSLRFRIPYHILGQSLEKIGGFNVPNSLKYDRPTLFIAGGNSPYRKPFEDRQAEIKAFYPNSHLEIVDGAGHWGKFKVSLYFYCVIDFFHFAISSCRETRCSTQFDHRIYKSRQIIDKQTNHFDLEYLI